MGAAERREQIISILIVRRHVTISELAYELDVAIRTVKRDIQALSFGYPIYTKPGVTGGIFIAEHYNPYLNTLTAFELEILMEMYAEADGERKKALFQILHKYGPDKLEV